MDRHGISIQEVRFYQALVASGKSWRTSRELAIKANIAHRTARLFTKRFADLGLVEIADVFPGHRYRLATKAEKTSAAYLTRIQHAESVFSTSSTEESTT